MPNEIPCIDTVRMPTRVCKAIRRIVKSLRVILKLD